MDEFVNELTKAMFLNNPIFWILIIVAILGIIFIIIKAKVIGNIGEWAVDQKLKNLPENLYKVIDDVMLEINGQTHQIDHIVISKYGIFVIETKCYNGIITGKENDYYWYQYLGKNKYKLKNPIHQNYGHIKSICESLSINEKNIISIVCFTNQSKLNIDVKSIVIQRKDLSDKILELSTDEKNIDVDNIYNKLVNLNIVDKEKRKQHVIEAKNKRNETESNIKNMVCPKCGGQLVERNGKYGKFVGCSNYPKCNFIKK